MYSYTYTHACLYTHVFIYIYTHACLYSHQTGLAITIYCPDANWVFVSKIAEGFIVLFSEALYDIQPNPCVSMCWSHPF